MSEQTPPGATSALNSEAFASLTFDPDCYRSFLEDGDLSRERQDELLRDLWSIVVGFADLGFGLHPIQHVSDLQRTLDADSRPMLAFNQNSNIVETDDVAKTSVMAAGKKDS
jgi:hypothetical protein